MKKLKYFIIAGILVAIAVAYYAYSEFNRKPADLSSVKTAQILKSNELFSAYSSEERTSDSLYLGKVISVIGKVAKVEKDEKGLNTVMLGTDVEGSYVSCQLDNNHNEDASGLAEGSEVTMKGECTGVLSDVVLVRCVVQK